MAQRGPTRPTAHIEESIGFVGMFGVLFLGVTVFCELTGRPALGWALTLLVCVLGVVALDRWRVAVLRRTTPTDGTGGVPVAPVRPAAAAPSTNERGHRHVGWDELAPGGRRPEQAARPTPAPARTGPVGDVTRPSDG
ncbi:hypothetical protein DEJ17_14235 [Curtobacterium sp. MCSS17_011]|uniref:hypothetical protein n=1 Tax=Curtobacterium sp. MCSS17_011 TaxID=2175643 RepID=UPI000D81357C|nr:hypothetical protein [Curtobacterium sp. MCSS17_011]PYY54554.1 hypothetical protein DEJ17_14235 [Curtobacterium sp. MCSS17_011]